MGKPRILCVDDEEAILEGLELSLRKSFRVVSATSGAEGLRRLQEEGPFPVVVSDMRMPGMSGAEFLTQVRLQHPASMRILLTGQADMASAISAVNEGQVFRFLTKPCPARQLLPVLDEAMEVHRLRSVEKLLLDQTLRGSIKALTDLLAMTHPAVFGRSTRVSETVVRVLDAGLELTPRWSIEIAAMVCQVGFVTLDDAQVDDLYHGRVEDKKRRELARQNFEVCENLLGNIPRMEPVIDILRGVVDPKNSSPSADLLRAAIEIDVSTSRGVEVKHAIGLLRERKGFCPSETLDVLSEALGATEDGPVREIAIRDVKVGMVFVEDVKTTAGLLLITRGFVVTESFRQKALGFRRGFVAEPVRVTLPNEA